MTDSFVIGVDGGGTKTAAVATRVGEKKPLKSSLGGPSSISAMSVNESVYNVVDTVSKLNIDFNCITAICIGVAGFSAVGKRQEFESKIRVTFPFANMKVVPDYEIAHAALFQDRVGVTVVAGTGSIAYARNRSGESIVTGGYGYLVDDIGSGYGLGRQVLATAGKVFDGSSEATVLFELFRDATGISSREELVSSVYGGTLDRTTIAALSRLVSQAADADDSTAVALLMHAGGALARVAQAAIGRLFGASESIVVGKTGSLWEAGGELDLVFERSVCRSHAATAFIRNSESPVIGALRIAEECLNNCSNS